MLVEKLLVAEVGVLEMKGNPSTEIAMLCVDSSKVEYGSVFFAIRGSNRDGHSFIPDAVEKGALAVVCEEFPEETDPKVCYIKVKNSSVAMAWMASEFYQNPSKKIKVIGVTGTNGKTTIATLLYRAFRDNHYKVGLLSTIENRINDVVFPSTHTTTHAIELQKFLYSMVEAGCTHVFMEVSSHAVHQHRIDAIDFDGGIFTNLTRDHLDYHKTFAEYLKAKKMFFDHLPAHAFALSNIDDKNGEVMMQNTPAKRYTYALRTAADFKARIVENAFTGLDLEINQKEVLLSLVGRFNAYNILAIYGCCCLLGMDELQALCTISKLKPADGRFQIETYENTGVISVVDYAHTPDALKNVLETMQDTCMENQRILCVVGCGGNRDKGKRPIMAEIAYQYADELFLTSDNPRMEDPEQILEEMMDGLKGKDLRHCYKIANREEAIKLAASMAQKGDVILVAGKGHETYQEIQGVRHHFNDSEILRKYLN